MLRQRILTALVLAPLAIAAVLYLATDALAALAALVGLVAFAEWARLAGLGGRLPRAAYAVAGTATGLLLWYWPPAHRWLGLLVYCALVFWPLAMLWLARGPYAPGPGSHRPLLKAVAGPLFVLPAWQAALLIHAELGPWWLLYVMVLMWVADSGAYFSGKRWGHRRLSPRVSPGKTVAGLLGALVLSVPYALAGGRLLPDRGVDPWLLVLLSLLVVAISVVGDLFVSLMKRQAGLKDSGHLLPGHGGILDRLDSLSAAAPFFYIGLQWARGGA